MTRESADPGTGGAMSDNTDFTLETIIYLVFGVFMLLLGVLLLKIGTGELSYNQDSTYGLLLVITSIYVITTGKTQFGEFSRSRLLVILAFCTAVVGTIACLVPGSLSGPVQVLTGLFLLVGGITLFLQLVIAKDKARLWITIPGILQHLTIACAFVYLMEILIGLVTLFPGITTVPITAVLCILFGISFFYLAWCVRKVALEYPLQVTSAPGATGTRGADAAGRHFLFREATLSTSITLFLMMGMILLIIAILAVPCGLGIISYSYDSQFGLLLVIMALQVLALGETPFGVRTRSWLLILAGLLFAASGMVSCIAPGLLSEFLLLTLLGVWNLIAGCVGLVKIVLPILHNVRHPPDEPILIPPIIKKLLITVTILQLATIVFGLNMLVPGLFSSMVILVLLFIMSFLIIRVAYIQTILPVPEGSV